MKLALSTTPNSPFGFLAATFNATGPEKDSATSTNGDLVGNDLVTSDASSS